MFENNDEDRYSLRNALNQGNYYKVFKKVDDNFLFIKQNIEQLKDYTYRIGSKTDTTQTSSKMYIYIYILIIIMI